MSDKAEFTTLGVRVEDRNEIKHIAWYERMKIADMVPLAVRFFANATPTERAEILARQHCTPVR
jgi:hypothetical protein